MSLIYEACVTLTLITSACLFIFSISLRECIHYAEAEIMDKAATNQKARAVRVQSCFRLSPAMRHPHPHAFRNLRDEVHAHALTIRLVQRRI